MSNENVLQEFSKASAAAVERASQAVVAVNARRHMLAGGVHWREGLIVTVNHAVRREDEITVLLPDGRSVSATLAGRDPATDLALLKAPSGGVGLPVMGDSAALKAGNLVLAVGRVEAGPRASLGVIGVRGGAWRTWRGGQIDQLIRLGFELHPTLSGGMLSDLEGRCLGIITAGLSRTLGVAIPTATIDRQVDLLLKKGHIPQGYLGVGLWPVEIPLSTQSRLAVKESKGLMVQHVEPGGPADKAGLLLGDILLRLNAKSMAGIHELHSLLSAEAVGTKAKAVVVRAGALIEADIVIEERPR